MRYIHFIIFIIPLLISISSQASLTYVAAGGIGGNPKTGKLYYDGQTNHPPAFIVARYDNANLCYLENEYVIIRDELTDKYFQFDCATKHPDHKVYWNDKDDAINGGYSPNNDVIYAFTVVYKMFKEWYGIDGPIMKDGKPVRVRAFTHMKAANAYYMGEVDGFHQMLLGDGDEKRYPYTSLGVIAHELAHGFTAQHSDLLYTGESGGLNESFSDMADQAAHFYAFKKNDWMHDSEIIKEEGKAIRYLDDPTKDCEGVKVPGVDCSVNHISQLKESTDVHYSSGIFNKVFYLLSTTKNWDARKAFAIMLHANRFYWTPTTNFQQAACTVLHSTKELNYEVNPVINAFKAVGIDTAQCPG